MIKNLLNTTLWTTCVLACVLSFATTLHAEEVKDDAEARDKSALLDPTHESWARQAPDTFYVRFETTQGNIVIEVKREWAPIGADRFYNLVDNGFYDGCRFFRVIHDFMVQFGVNGDPEVSDIWRDQPLVDDPKNASNIRGRVTFAMSGVNSRTTQVFISYADNSFLDQNGFTPFGHVVKGMDVADKLNGQYGEGAPKGDGPDQGRIQKEGNPYLDAEFSELDHIIKAQIVVKQVEEAADEDKGEAEADTEADADTGAEVEAEADDKDEAAE